MQFAKCEISVCACRLLDVSLRDNITNKESQNKTRTKQQRIENNTQREDSTAFVL